MLARLAAPSACLRECTARKPSCPCRLPCSPSSSCSFYDAESVRYAGAATPTGGLRDVQPAVTCEIVLMEHQLDTNESVLFVHKKLRPIK